MPLDAGATASGRDDDVLIARFAAGDQDAARVLAARHVPRVLALAARMLGDRAEAEDVAQEAMLRLWRIAPDWRPGAAAPGTWLHRVAANLCIDRLRRHRRMSPEEPPDAPDDAPSAVDRLAARDRAAALRAAIDELPDRQRAALVMRHFGDMANPEIAARLDVSVEAVESLLARARRALAARLGSQRGRLGLTE